jgi:hypothetical protein
MARTTIVGLNAEYHERLARFLRSLQGEIGGPPQGLTVERIVEILVRSAEGARHDTKAQGDRKLLSGGCGSGADCHCRDEKVIRTRNVSRQGVPWVSLVREQMRSIPQANKEFVTGNTLMSNSRDQSREVGNEEFNRLPSKAKVIRPYESSRIRRTTGL